ncbi:hypothetical protein V6N13_124078 [Hibiscus sabdariffa]
MKGFFADVFQSYTSMMIGPSNALEQFYPSTPMFQISVAPLVVYPPTRSNFSFNYGIVQHTPTGSLFVTGSSGSVARDDNEDKEEDDDAEVDDDEDDDAEVVRRDPLRNRLPPCCGTGGHRRH